MSRQYWTPEQDAELHRMVAAGCGYVEMGEAFGRTRNALRVRVHKFGLKLDVDAWKKRAKTAMRKVGDEAEYRRRLAEGQRRAWTPERRLAARESALRRKFWEAGQAAMIVDAAAVNQRKADASRARHAERLAWCPADRRADYHLMVRKVGMAAARAFVEEDMRRAERAKQAAAAKLSPFERQLARVASGQSRVYELPRRAPTLDGRS